MVEINEQILQKYGIYKTRKLKENEKTKLLKIKKEIEKLIHMTIERLYVINESAWGKNAEEEQYAICILMDKRCKELEDIRETLVEYSYKKQISILFWTLCQFEKRKNVPTEEDYYIARYGIKVYDSGKQPDINENVKTTQYAAQMECYRVLHSYKHTNPDYFMKNLIRIYTLKIGYAAIGRDGDLKRDYEFAKLVSNDKKAIEIMDNYFKQTNKNDKNKILDEFEQYLESVKQVKFPMKLEEKPTMDVYGKLLKRKEKQGTLDIKTLTKEDLYIMYIIQEKNTFEIAELYDVENKTISTKRNNWNIKIRENALVDEDNIINKTIHYAEEKSSKYAYALLKKSGIMQFEEYTLPILEYMLDGNTYLLKEFWQFIEGDETQLESLLFKGKTNFYYRASMCMELFLQNELVEEVDFKQYKITKKGKELVWYCNQNEINQINIPVICEKFNRVNYYDLYYQKGYPTEIEEVTWEKLYNAWEKYCKKNFPELLDKAKLPIDDKLMKNKIEKQEDIALIWMYLFFVNLKWKNLYPQQWENTIFVSVQDILEPITEKIKEKNIEVIPNEKMKLNQFLDISNLCKYTKIKEVADMTEYAAISCAYLLKNIEG